MQEPANETVGKQFQDNLLQSARDKTGVLASFPFLARNLDVQRVPWPRPRERVMALAGKENQSLPLLILADGNEGLTLVAEKDAILRVLSERHGFPESHP